jgi:hypothetical protein
VRDEKYVQISVGKPEGKRLLRNPRRRSEDNIKMELRKYGARTWTSSGSIKDGEFPEKRLSVSQEGLCSVEIFS